MANMMATHFEASSSCQRDRDLYQNLAAKKFIKIVS